MLGTLLTELVKLLPQLAVTFFGVFLAFMLDRYIERRKKSQDRSNLLKDLCDELDGIKEKLTGEGHLHFPDIWDSAISSGQIRLLESDQVRKLASVYRDVRRIEYEAMRVRDLAEEYRLAKTKGQVESDLAYLWSRYSATQKDREKKLLEKIKELLKEKWWKT